MLDSLTQEQWAEALGFYYMEPWHFDPRWPVARLGEDARHPLYGIPEEARLRMPGWTQAGFEPPRYEGPDERGHAAGGVQDRRPWPEKPLAPDQMLLKIMAVNKDAGGVNMWRPAKG